MSLTKTVFFLQHQGQEADFSDGSADPTLHADLETGLAAFQAESGHRRLLALSVDYFSNQPNGMAVELKRV